MKKLLTLCLGFIPCAALAATNKISMVTYFPVPYVAYSQVSTTEQMDIGLTNSCDMTLGCSETSATLNAAQVNVKGGTLNLDGGRGINGGALSLGSGVGEGKISFRNVRIQTGNVESVNAEDIKATNLNLFGKAFPDCATANGDSNGQMQWTSLKLKGATENEIYLACGDAGGGLGGTNPGTAEETPDLILPCTLSTVNKTCTRDGYQGTCLNFGGHACCEIYVANNNAMTCADLYGGGLNAGGGSSSGGSSTSIGNSNTDISQ